MGKKEQGNIDFLKKGFKKAGWWKNPAMTMIEI